MRSFFVPLLLILAVMACVSTASVPSAPTEGRQVLPQAPDYGDSTQWFIRWREAPADLFYIISTETGDYLLNGDSCHHANTYDKGSCPGMAKEMRAVDSLFSGNLNYFSPYYRQATIQSWTSESLALSRLAVPLGDTERSWHHYLRHFNQGRPFILAGFSQGAHAMLDIMRKMPDSVYQRMVAAYVIGYKVSQQDVDTCSTIKPAQEATDLGVTICYNSVRSPECTVPIVTDGNVLCINPVNWRTDTVAATFGNGLTVRCHPESHLLLVDGYQQRRLLPVIGKDGNYHDRELKFYYPYIRQNMADRVEAYLRRR